MTISGYGHCHATGKVCYESRTAARDTMSGMQRKKLRKRKTDRLNVFRCVACEYWHVGNKPK